MKINSINNTSFQNKAKINFTNNPIKNNAIKNDEISTKQKRRKKLLTAIGIGVAIEAVGIYLIKKSNSKTLNKGKDLILEFLAGFSIFGFMEKKDNSKKEKINNEKSVIAKPMQGDKTTAPVMTRSIKDNTEEHINLNLNEKPSENPVIDEDEIEPFEATEKNPVEQKQEETPLETINEEETPLEAVDKKDASLETVNEKDIHFENNIAFVNEKRFTGISISHKKGNITTKTYKDGLITEEIVSGAKHKHYTYERFDTYRACPYDKIDQITGIVYGYDKNGKLYKKEEEMGDKITYYYPNGSYKGKIIWKDGIQTGERVNTKGKLQSKWTGGDITFYKFGFIPYKIKYARGGEHNLTM